MTPEFLTLHMTEVLSAALAAYLLGSVAFGAVVARVMNLGDLSRIGSGNIGATNVLRTGNRTAAALTLLLDSGKGAAGVALGYSVGDTAGAAICGLAAFIGHLFPLWRRFRGGKGVATFLGVLLAISFPAGAASCACWLLAAAVFRYSSLASLASSALSVPVLLVLGQAQLAPFAALMTVLIYWRHLDNIRRLMEGTESRIKLGTGS